MKKRLLIALSVIAIIIIAIVVFFYTVTAMEKQEPVEITTPPTPVTQ